MNFKLQLEADNAANAPLYQKKQVQNLFPVHKVFLQFHFQKNLTPHG